MKSKLLRAALLLVALGLSTASSFAQGAKKPNILVIFGDDIGQTNVSAYSMGMMGYRTPNIDRVAKEGMMFTDYYAEQSCTAGVRRSSPINADCAPACPRSACRVVSALQSTTTATSSTLPMRITHHVGKPG